MDTLAQATDTAETRRRKRRRGILAILLASSVATLGAGSLSLAVFSDTDATDGSWTTGTIILGASPATAFTATGIMPGDTDSQTITVANTGTSRLRYAMTTSATNTDSKGLAGQMTLKVEAGACGATTATLYNNLALGSAAFGDPAQGDDTGDREVAAGSTDQLCFTWDFPLGSGNGFKNAATTATFTFAGEQTQNNP